MALICLVIGFCIGALWQKNNQRISRRLRQAVKRLESDEVFFQRIKAETGPFDSEDWARLQKFTVELLAK